MELLIGVYHKPEHVGKVEEIVRDNYPKGVKSLMVELPSNYQLLNQVYSQVFGNKLDDEFFVRLATTFSAEGAKVVYGDRERLPKQITKEILAKQRKEFPIFLLALAYLDALVLHRRDRTMMRNIQQYDPQVVVVGRRHADYIKRRFPNVPYVAFDYYPKNLKLEFLVGDLFVDSKLPDRIITVRI